MANISVSLPSDGETIDAADYNTPINTIVNEINGNLDNSNIDASAAISGSKLADNSIDLGAKTSTWDGWIEVTDSWTYASATTVTVPSDATAKYSVGDKVQFNQSGVKYFQITAVASTTLTLFGIGGVTVANAAISDIEYSKAQTPTGYSQAWQSYTPTITASSSNPNIGTTGTITGYYIQIGKTVHVYLKVTVGGSGISAGSGSYRFSLPVNADTTINSAQALPLGGVANVNITGGTVLHFGTVELPSTINSYVNLRLWATAGGASDPVKSLGLFASGTGSLASGDNILMSFTYWAA